MIEAEDIFPYEALRGRVRVRHFPTLPNAEVLALMAEGRSNAGIAQTLGVSERTVEASIERGVLRSIWRPWPSVEVETWLVPIEGWLVDKFGPKLLVLLGGVMAGLGGADGGHRLSQRTDVRSERHNSA